MRKMKTRKPLKIISESRSQFFFNKMKKADGLVARLLRKKREENQIDTKK